MHHLSAASAPQQPLVSESDLWLWLLVGVTAVAVAALLSVVPPIATWILDGSDNQEVPE